VRETTDVAVLAASTLVPGPPPGVQSAEATPAGVCRRPVLKTPQTFRLRTAPLVAFAALAVLALTPALSSAQTPAGSLDPSFGNAGVSALNGVGPGNLRDVATYDSGPEQGKLVAAGMADDPVRSILLARFNANGTLDQSFGTGGIVVSSLNGLQAFASTVAAAPDGGVIVLAEGSSLNKSVIARFTESGDPDDGGGQAGTGFGSCGCGFVGGLPSITGIAVATHGPGAGDILYTAQGTVGRLTADGSPLWHEDLAMGASAVAERPDGDLVVTGTAGSEISAAELHSDGSIDHGFGTNGVASFDISDRVQAPSPESVAIDSVGRAVIGGIVNAPGVCSGFVARLTDAGGLDGGFGAGGVQSLPRTLANEVVVDAQDRVLAGGTVDCRQMISSDMGAVRLQEANGAPDPSFGTAGTAAVTPASDVSGNGSGIALTERGIVVAGELKGAPSLASFLGASEGDSGGVASDVAASPAVDVQRVITPKKWRKLIHPGVRVLAGCDLACEVDVTVTVTQKVADAMGIPSTVVARGTGRPAAGKHQWVFAMAPRKIRDALKSFSGHGRLHVAVTAS
jgi:uncharacterized delta-60 repeat protein